MTTIKTAEHLRAAATLKLAVVGIGVAGRPFPAAFVLNMNFAQVSHAMERGHLKIYQPKRARK